MNRFIAVFALLLVIFISVTPAAGISASSALPVQEMRPALSQVAYDTGSPTLTDVWVDPLHGSDTNTGASASAAFRTIAHAWQQIPANSTLTHGYRINLQPGTYAASAMPNYWENRMGTFSFPVWFKGRGSNRSAVVLQGDINLYNSSYIYFENFSLERNGDAFHCELCNHILLRNLVLDGGGGAQEVLKVNQSQYFYVEKSSLANAWDNVIDFVAVQHGHIVNNTLAHGGDWCAYVKGGSAYILLESNLIHHCGTGGFTAGQGSGFQFLVQPWITYEAYDVKFVNNVVHDTTGAGVGVNGGYNILMAYNTLYRVGSQSHAVEVVFGYRSCDGQPGDAGREKCGQNLSAGGWGTTVVSNGENDINIPDKNVYIYNNLILNPTGFKSAWQHFAIYEPRTNTNNASNRGPSPARTDENLQIKGNVIWNGPSDLALGIEDSLACVDSNPTCNRAQLLADNHINTLKPGMYSPSTGNFHPSGSWVSSASPVTIPDFTWDLTGIPEGNNSNAVLKDFENKTRSSANRVGAYITPFDPNSVAPGVPVLFTPGNNVLLSTFKPLLDWSNSSLPSGSTFKYYRVQVDDNSDFSSTVLDKTTLSGSILTSKYQVATALGRNKKYYWRVRAYNISDKVSAWSAVRNFRTKP